MKVTWIGVFRVAAVLIGQLEIEALLHKSQLYQISNRTFKECSALVIIWHSTCVVCSEWIDWFPPAPGYAHGNEWQFKF